MKIGRTLFIVLFLALALSVCKSTTEERRAQLLNEEKKQSRHQQSPPQEPYYYGLIEEYRSVLAQDPGNRAATIALANAYYDSRKWRSAIVYYERALSLDPHDADILTDLGTCYRNSGRPDDALRYYRKALRQNPEHLNARYNMGIVYAHDKMDYAEAIREWEHLLRIAPAFPHAWTMRESIASYRKKLPAAGGAQ